MLVEFLFDALSCFGGKLLRDRVGQFIRVLVCGVPQKTDLFSVASTPLAEQQVQLQAEPLRKGQLAIERVRLQTRCLLATR